MIDRLTKMREERDEKGFTLIELLVVVVIIGILVAIAIPLYLNYRKGAQDSAAKSDVRNSIPLVEQYLSENNLYPADQAAFDGLSPQHSNGVTLTYTVNATKTQYCVQGAHSATGNTWAVSTSSGGVAKGTCAAGVFTAS